MDRGVTDPSAGWGLGKYNIGYIYLRLPLVIFKVRQWVYAILQYLSIVNTVKW